MAQRYFKITYYYKLLTILFIIVSLIYLASNYMLRSEKSEKVLNTISQITATDTVFSSTGKNSYKIIAKHVVQSKEGVYFLNTISGIYDLENKDEIDMSARSGYFDSVLDKAQLENDVKIMYLGYDIKSDILNLDLKHYAASSPTNVHVEGVNGSIDADNFTTTEKFNQIIFHGNVRAAFIVNKDR